MVRVPGAFTELATRWLTDQLLRSRVFVNTVESAHRFGKEMRAGMMEGLTDEPPAQPPPDNSAKARATMRSTFHAERDRARHTQSSTSTASDHGSSSEKKPPDDDFDDKMQALLEKLRNDKK